MRPARFSPDGASGFARYLRKGALVCLLVSGLARPLLSAWWRYQASDLFLPDASWWTSTPAAGWILNVLAASGVCLACWYVLAAGRSWRVCGLELAAGVMLLAAVISVPGASDKRVAINVATSVVLQLMCAAALLQVLDACARRVTVAALVGVCTVNCWKATAQYLWEIDETIDFYNEHKAEFWAARGIPLDSPQVKMYEARILARQVTGYFNHPNALAGLLLLGLGAAGCAAAGAAKALRRGGEDAGGRSKGMAAVGLALACAVAAWQLLIAWQIGSAGFGLGLLAAVLLFVAAALLRKVRRAGFIIVGAFLVSVLVGHAVVGLSLRSGPESLLRRVPVLAGSASAVVRAYYWSGAVELFSRRPLSGVGPGQFGKAYLRIKPPEAAEEVSHPHNWLFAIAAEWGLRVLCFWQGAAAAQREMNRNDRAAWPSMG